MQYRLPPMQNQHVFHNAIRQVNQGNLLQPHVSPNISPRNYAVPSASYMGSAYPVVQGLQYPLAYPGGMMSSRPLSGSTASVPPSIVNSQSAASPSVSGSSGVQIEGC